MTHPLSREIGVERCNRCGGELRDGEGLVDVLECVDCGRQIPAAALPCECGCGKPRAPRSKYHDYSRCRQRAYRKGVRAAARAAGLPGNLSLAAVEASRDTRARNGDAQKATHARPARRKPDLRISYRRAVEAVADELQDLAPRGMPRARARRRAQDALRECLPPRLREAA